MKLIIPIVSLILCVNLSAQDSYFTMQANGTLLEIKYNPTNQNFSNKEYSVIRNENCFYLVKHTYDDWVNYTPTNSNELTEDDRLILADLGLMEDMNNSNTIAYQDIDVSIDAEVQSQINYLRERTSFLSNVSAKSIDLFPIFENVLANHNLPQALKYLPVIESGLNTNVRSSAGATGLWQFMKYTAIQMGLSVNKKFDERRDVQLSTEAAARYLKYLFQKFGDWKLALAAYNAGEGTVKNALDLSGKSSFEEISHLLPNETQIYVPRFIAAYHIFENNASASLSLSHQNYSNMY